MRRVAGSVLLVAGAAMLLGAADGRWLRRVSPKDHARSSPLLATPEDAQRAAAAGAQIYHNECAKCHGDDALGKGNRPPVISLRVERASDGDLFWLMTNGNPWKGMPPWNMLPEKQRWQLVAYLRALNVNDRSGVPAVSEDEKKNEP